MFDYEGYTKARQAMTYKNWLDSALDLQKLQGATVQAVHMQLDEGRELPNREVNDYWSEMVKRQPYELVLQTETHWWLFYHEQDCCESVYVQDVTGDLQDLIGSPITLAAESVSELQSSDAHIIGTATFYKFATLKGYVDIRWLGESNGYYSESVEHVCIPRPQCLPS